MIYSTRVPCISGKKKKFFVNYPIHTLTTLVKVSYLLTSPLHFCNINFTFSFDYYPPDWLLATTPHHFALKQLAFEPSSVQPTSIRALYKLSINTTQKTPPPQTNKSRSKTKNTKKKKVGPFGEGNNFSPTILSSGHLFLFLLSKSSGISHHSWKKLGVGEGMRWRCVRKR